MDWNKLFARTPRHSLLTSVRYLEQSLCQNLQTKLQFHQYVAPVYPKQLVAHLRYCPRNNTVHIYSHVLGLLGITGALPAIYTEYTQQALKQKNSALRDFYDLFYDRLVNYYYRAWQRRKLYVDYEQSLAESRPSDFAKTLCSLLNVQTQRQHIGFAFLGHYANINRSPVALERVVAALVKTTVKVSPFTPCWESLPPHLQTQLTEQNNHCLGRSTVLGKKVRMDHQNITVTIIAKHQTAFNDFIADVALMRQLESLVQSYIGPHYKSKILITLTPKSRQAMQLGHDSKHRPKLGLNSFLGGLAGNDSLA